MELKPIDIQNAFRKAHEREPHNHECLPARAIRMGGKGEKARICAGLMQLVAQVEIGK